MDKKVQICATVPESLGNAVAEIAIRDNRTFSQTVALLLQQSVKERNRKRKNAKKDNTQHNPNDLGESNCQ